MKTARSIVSILAEERAQLAEAIRQESQRIIREAAERYQKKIDDANAKQTSPREDYNQ